MSFKHQVLLFMILLSCVVQFFRGFNHTRRTYTASDAVGVLIEGPVMIWLLVTG